MKNITTYFILGTISLIAIYDFWIIEYMGKQDSISATIIRWSYDYPSFTFLMGFTMGHLFWKMKDSDVFKKDQDKK